MESIQTRRKPGWLTLILPLVCVVVAQTFLIFLSLEVLSGGRTYLHGESLWSKGIKDAIHYLSLYAESHSEVDYAHYKEAIAIPLSDLRGRQEMETPAFNHEIAYTCLLAGGNQPEDIDKAIWLFRNFHKTGTFENVVQRWAETDQPLLRLKELGESIHQAVHSYKPNVAQIAAWKAEINAVNEQIMASSRAFSRTLSESSRTITNTLVLGNVGAGLILIVFGSLATRNVLRQREEAESALKKQQARAQITLAALGDAVLTVDRRGRVYYMNPAAERLTQWRGAQAYKKPLNQLFNLVDDETHDDEQNLMERILAGEISSTISCTLQLHRLDQSKVMVSLVAAPLQHNGSLSGAVLVLHDMTRERLYVANLSWQATHDALTRLFNRREFDRRLTRAVKTQQEDGTQHALLYLDLDQFKVVNDTCGHTAGDRLICQAANQLQHYLREGDTLARLGGDEFGVLLENCSPELALEIAEKLRRAIQSLPFTVDERSFEITASIGLVTLAPAQFGTAEALQAADMACYLAKEKGRNRVQRYSPENTELSERRDEMRWSQQIPQAMKDKRFRLYKQDIVPIKGDADAGAHIEVLLRLQDEQGNLIAPNKFIPAAERYGLMPQLDRWVVENTFATLAARQHSSDTPIATCSINLSGATVGDDDFLTFLHDQIALHKLVPETICFEVTETTAIANLPNAIRLIKELQNLGCRFALDDFGVGMSSFSYLKQLPVDYLKIDGNFIKDILTDPIDYAMVKTINDLGQAMGKRTIAEFVESAEILAALKDIGVDYAQGYAIAEPQPFTASKIVVTEFEPTPDDSTPKAYAEIEEAPPT
ncbi:MAG: EAL domain-containing protein [Betaproteobacteria bacterium]|nr:EAL domain-containing protein [Betaproteobacteria bacterium]